MKIIVINFSGNVGKSTIAHHVLAPRMPGAEVISVETINSEDGQNTPSLRGTEYRELQEHIQTIDDVIVDVGASNAEDVVRLMKQYSGSHEDFDLFIVPTVASSKQQRDTIATIEALADMGVTANKIKFVFCLVDESDHIERTFSGLFDYVKSDKKAVVDATIKIRRNELFDNLKGSRVTIAELVADTTDYKAAIRDSETSEQKVGFARKLAFRRLAFGVTEELDGVFNKLLASSYHE